MNEINDMDSRTRLSDETVREILEYFKATIPNANCPMCKNNSIAISDQLASIPIITFGEDNTKTNLEAYRPAILAQCPNCKYVLMFELPKSIKVMFDNGTMARTK